MLNSNRISWWSTGRSNCRCGGGVAGGRGGRTRRRCSTYRRRGAGRTEARTRATSSGNTVCSNVSIGNTRQENKAPDEKGERRYSQKNLGVESAPEVDL